MYKFKIYIILILIIILYFLYKYNKDHFKLANENIFIDYQTGTNEPSLTQNYLILIEYRNDCGKSREFMYGCCDHDISRGFKQTDTFKTKSDDNNHPILQGKKYKNLMEEYEKNIIGAHDESNLYLGPLGFPSSSPTGSSDVSESTSTTSTTSTDTDSPTGSPTDFTEETEENIELIKLEANNIDLSDKQDVCLDYTNFIDSNLNNLCRIKNGMTNFNILKKFLNKNTYFEDSNFQVKFMSSSKKVPILKLFEIKTDDKGQKQLKYPPNIYRGDLNNICNLLSWIYKAVKNKKYTDNNFKDINNSIKCIPGKINIVSKNYKEKKEEIEITRKYTDNFIESRPKIIVSNLLTNDELTYNLIIFKNKDLDEYYDKERKLVYWILWGINIKDDLLKDDNGNIINNSFTINELNQDEEESSHLITNKDTYVLYPYMLFKNDDLQLDNQEISNFITENLPGSSTQIKKIERNKINNIDLNVNIEITIDLLSRIQYQKLINIYNKYYNISTNLFYKKLFREIDIIKTNNNSIYEEYKINEKIHYNIKNENDKKRLDKYYEKDKNDRSLLCRMFIYPFQYLDIKKNIINETKFMDDGYYEIILLYSDLNEKSIKIKDGSKVYYLSDYNNILYLPGKKTKGSKLNLTFDKNCGIILRKSKYIIEEFDDSMYQKELSNIMNYDIVNYVNITNIEDTSFSKFRNVYKFSDSYILEVFNTYGNRLNRNIITKPIDNYFSRDTNSNAVIIFYDDERNEYELQIENEILIKDLYDKYPELRHYSIVNNYLYYSNEVEDLVNDSNNTLIKLKNLVDSDIKNNKKVNNKSLNFKKNGIKYRLNKDEIENLKKARINSIDINNYYDIYKNCPTIELELFKYGNNNQGEKTKIFRNDQLLKKISDDNQRGVLKVYLVSNEGSVKEDIKEENLIYCKWDIDLYNINKDEKLIINTDNCTNTLYNLDILGKKYKNIYLLFKFDIYKKQNLDFNRDKLEPYIKKLKDNTELNYDYISVINELLNQIATKTYKTSCTTNNKYSELLLLMQKKIIEKKQFDVKLEETDYIMNDKILYLLDKIVNKKNIIEYTNFSSYGNIQLKQNECRLTYKIKSYEKRYYLQNYIIDDKTYKNSFKERNANSINQMKVNFRTSTGSKRKNNNNNNKSDTKTIDEIINEYKTNIFDIFSGN